MNDEHKNTHRTAHASAQLDYLNRLAQYCDYGVTLQTNLSTYAIGSATMERYLDATRSSLYKFRVRLNRLLTGNGWRRKDEYMPLFIAAVEGSLNTYDKNRTLHVHLALGNLPAAATSELLEDGIRQIWAATDVGTTDIRLDKIKNGTEHRWNKYICKETYKGNFDVVDYNNMQIPKYISETL